MKYDIAKGVSLTTIPATKFKNIKILINFTFPARHENFAKLALLAELLENCSARYDSELLVSRQLSKMYGASFGVSVLRYGNQHTLQVSITFPNDKFVPEKGQLTSEVLSFLQEMIEDPYVDGNQFNQEYFRIHQSNMINYLDSIQDNKGFFATLQLQKLYYANDPDHGNFLMGNQQDMRAINSGNLFEFYRQVLSQAKISILVGGDLNEKVIVNGFKHFQSFVDRTPQTFELKVKPLPIKEVQRAAKDIEGSQSVLSMAYELPIYFGDEQYFPAVIFNQLFGGSSRSLLFTNVREKNSLAYDIHSSYNSLVGMDTIQAGIDFVNEDRVAAMVNNQLQQMIDGNYSDELLEGVKQALINQHRSGVDHLGSLIEKQYLQHIIGLNLSDAEWELQVEAVTRRQISEVADQMSLRAVYQLNSRGR